MSGSTYYKGELEVLHRLWNILEAHDAGDVGRLSTDAPVKHLQAVVVVLAELAPQPALLRQVVRVVRHRFVQHYLILLAPDLRA